MNTRTRNLVLSGALSLSVLGAGTVAYGSLAPSNGSSSPATTRLVSASLGSVQTTVSSTGTLAPATSLDLNFANAGTLTAVSVKAADTVTAGQVLAKIDDAAAKVNFAAGQTVSGGGTGASSASSSSTASGASSASGSGASQVFATLVDPTTMVASVSWPESDAAKISVGQTATITVASLGSPVTGKVTELDTTSTVVSDVVTYAGTVTLDQVPAGAKSGMKAEVYWPGYGVIDVAELTLKHLLPLAASGLAKWGVDDADAGRLRPPWWPWTQPNPCGAGPSW